MYGMQIAIIESKNRQELLSGYTFRNHITWKFISICLEVSKRSSKFELNQFSGLTAIASKTKYVRYVKL